MVLLLVDVKGADDEEEKGHHSLQDGIRRIDIQCI
jgi:hypothetical protein